jgi:transcriptional regulator with XRE-family HTH domain
MANLLYGIIQRHMDEAESRSGYPVKASQVARNLGVSRGLLSAWKTQEGSLPWAKHLHLIAEGTDTPYAEVLWAALADAGYGPPWPARWTPPAQQVPATAVTNA